MRTIKNVFLNILILISLLYLISLYQKWSNNNYLENVIKILNIDAKISENGHGSMSCIEGKMFDHVFHSFTVAETRSKDYTVLELFCHLPDSNFVLEIHEIGKDATDSTFKKVEINNPDFDKLVVYSNQADLAKKILSVEVQNSILENLTVIQKSIYFKKNRLSCKVFKHFFDNSAIEEIRKALTVMEKMIKNIDFSNQ